MSAPEALDSATTYPRLSLYIGAVHFYADDGPGEDVVDPSSGEVIGRLPHASSSQLDDALAAAQQAFLVWRKSPALERSKVLRAAAQALRDDENEIARNLTRDQGKPFAEALVEVRASAEHIEWHAEECRRIYGRVVPARAANVHQYVVKEPVGVCAAFTPWNFPLSQAARKVAAAVGAGCSIVLKGPENTPSAVIALARAFEKAGLVPGVLNLVWGEPSDVSRHLLSSPIVQCVSFTGSVPVGKMLASMAGQRMQRATFELGGHAPAIVFDDANVAQAVQVLAASKFRNAGQVCVAPSRLFVHERVYDEFIERFAMAAHSVSIGNGLLPDVQMGPLAHPRRVAAMHAFVEDAIAHGASIIPGRRGVPAAGNFFAPTVLTDVPDSARIMRDEPFGPVVPVTRWCDLEDVLRRANSVPYGLAGFAFTRSTYNAAIVAAELDVGQLGINHFGMAVAELPMGGVKESGVGSEGGSETFDGFMKTKLVSHLALGH